MGKSARKLSAAQRRQSIIQAARKVFVERGFYGTTSRQLAEAAGVSEALLFKHFPTKRALYRAILASCCEQKAEKEPPGFEALPACTETVVRLVWGFVSHILGAEAKEEDRLFFRLILRSLMEEGEFTRVAIQGIPRRWVQKVQESLEAAAESGDLVAGAVPADLAGWLVHHLVSGFMMHSLPGQPIVEYRVSREELVEEIVIFCLRGIGLRNELLHRYLQKVKVAQREKAAQTSGKEGNEVPKDSLGLVSGGAFKEFPPPIPQVLEKSNPMDQTP